MVKNKNDIYILNTFYNSSLYHNLFSDMEYVGCYKNTCFGTKINLTVHNIDECTQACKHENHGFAGISEGERCDCGLLTCRRDSKVCESSCGVPCQNTGDDTLTTCGGIGFIQVYKGVCVYVGLCLCVGV